MSKQFQRYLLLFITIIAIIISVLSQAQSRPSPLNRFHSATGREHEVAFKGVFVTNKTSPAEFQRMSADDREQYVRYEVLPAMDYLFGPLTHRTLGSPQRTRYVDVEWSQARLRDGRVELPYKYRGLWIIERQLAASGSFEIPVPLNTDIVYSDGWKNCSDQDPEHQTPGFFWYFWDPARYGCDHVEGRHFQTVKVMVGRGTPNQTRTYPEYARMLADGRMSLTMAFGYVKDPSKPNPDRDGDPGMEQYRRFTQMVRKTWGSQLREENILQGDYKYSRDRNLVIGRRFSGRLLDTDVVLNIVTSAGIDQMELFAKSFAHDHDDLFAWFGHSRVGSGFDAERFDMMLKQEPNYYSIKNGYQIIYWGGCNSYSYYTLPFFEFKAQASHGADPTGSRNLDIIANGLPSYFSLNAANAMITARAFLNWERKATYQRLIEEIEGEASRMGQPVLAAVLGDEDNAR